MEGEQRLVPGLAQPGADDLDPAGLRRHFLLLRKLAFPRISDALDRRQKAIEDSIDTAERTRKEADELLAEYRERLHEARAQSEEIVARARKAAENTEREGKEDAKASSGRSWPRPGATPRPTSVGSP